MSKLKDRLRGYVRDAEHAFHAAPVEVGLAILAAAACSYAIEKDNAAFEVWIELVISIALAFSAAWIATLLNALNVLSRKQRWWLTLVGGALAAVYFGWIVDFEITSDRWRALMLMCAAAGFTLAVPALARISEDRNLIFRRVNGRFLVRAIGIVLYGLALFAGLALALTSVDKLFELDLHGSIYAHVFAWIMLALVPWVIVGGLPDYVRPLEETSDVARAVHRLVGFLVPPLLTIYYVILYAYVIRIVVLGELPKNLVSPMVIAAGLLGALALLFFYDRNEARDAMRPLRFAPVLFLPLTVIGFWALAPRIGQYGWTEFRALRVAILGALTLLAVGGTIRIVRRQSIPLPVILVVLAATLLLSAVGPWSVLAIARRDQTSRLIESLTIAGIRAPDGTFVSSTEKRVDNSVYDQISGSARYLKQHFGAESLEDILPSEATSDHALADLSSHFGLRRTQPSMVDRYQSAHLQAGTRVQVSPDLVVYRIGMIPPRTQDATAVTDSSVLRIAFDRDTFAVELLPLLREMTPVRSQDVGLPGQAAILPVLDRSGARHGSVMVLDAATDVSNDRLIMNRFEGILMLERITPTGTPVVAIRGRWR